MKLIILLYFCNAKGGSPTISCMALRHQITHLLGDEFRFVNDGTCTVECTYVWYPLFPQHNFWGNCRAIQLRAIIIWHSKARLWHCRMGEGGQGHSQNHFEDEQAGENETNVIRLLKNVFFWALHSGVGWRSISIFALRYR